MLQSSELITAVARRLKRGLTIWISLSKRKLHQFIFRYATANKISKIKIVTKINKTLYKSYLQSLNLAILSKSIDTKSIKRTIRRYYYNNQNYPFPSRYMLFLLMRLTHSNTPGLFHDLRVYKPNRGFHAIFAPSGFFRT